MNTSLAKLLNSLTESQRSEEELAAIETATNNTTITKGDEVSTITIPTKSLPLVALALKIATGASKGFNLYDINRDVTALQYLVATASDPELAGYVALQDKVFPVALELINANDVRREGGNRILKAFVDISGEIVNASPASV